MGLISSKKKICMEEWLSTILWSIRLPSSIRKLDSGSATMLEKLRIRFRGIFKKLSCLAVPVLVTVSTFYKELSFCLSANMSVLKNIPFLTF